MLYDWCHGIDIARTIIRFLKPLLTVSKLVYRLVTLVRPFTSHVWMLILTT